jgi:glycosyltransferase involved in cell wall biosynthesis
VQLRVGAPLHIVHVVLSATFAGVERYVVTVAGELVARGHAVTVIGDDRLLGAPFAGSQVSFVGASAIPAAARALRHVPAADVVHAHMTAAELAAVIGIGRRHTPIVATRHFAARRGASTVGRILAPRIERQLARQISISEFVARSIGEASTVIRNAVPDHPAVDPVGQVVLVTQRFDTEKRTHDALSAWRCSRLWEDGWELWLAGDGRDRVSLETYVTRNGLPGVRFLGHRDDVDSLRTQAGIVLATAPAEPFGLAVGEAMAAGLPVVAAAAGGHLETVGAARPDLLYPVADVEACAALLRRLATDLPLRRESGRDLRAFQQRELRIDAHVDRLESVYRTVVDERREPATGRLRVLRVHHAAVVSSWRERDRRLRQLDCDVTLVSARRWNEGGLDVTLDAETDDFVVGARTWGRHPYSFVYDPLPLVRPMRGRLLDVIDVHEEPASLAALEMRMLRALFQRRTPIVFYGAQNIEKRYPIPFRWIERGSLRAAAGAHCCNEEAADIFRRKGLLGVTAVIGLGVDLDRFATARCAHAGGFRLGYVGRLEERKGVRVLLAAVADLPHVRLDFYGDGPERGVLDAEIRKLGLGDRVTVHGFVPDDDLPSIYGGFDAVAVPSLRTSSWVEQFGRVAVEAMASGAPVLASDDGALREVVGDAGVLVTPGDVDAWRDAIATLAGDDAERDRLQKLGAERVRRYSWERIAAAHRAFFDEVVNA